jgi:hypothetical protein
MSESVPTLGDHLALFDPQFFIFHPFLGRHGLDLPLLRVTYN